MDHKIECVCDVLEEINEFYSFWEFERFQKYISELVVKGDLIEITVREYYAGFPERWFKCRDCHKIWRLVHPDFPFKGLWCKV